MDKLTVEAAESEKLSWNPFRRHKQVENILNDPSIVGVNVVIVTNPYRLEENFDDETLVVFNPGLFLGRTAMINVAKELQQIDNLAEPQGELDGKDF